MSRKRFSRLLFVPVLLALAGTAQANPVLRSDVVVSSAIVTVADLFDHAGLHAERPLFRAPAPGTTGEVSVQAVRIAAAKAGVMDFENPGVLAVKVSRSGISVSGELLQTLINDDLARRGILSFGMRADVVFDAALPILHAEDHADPVRLLDLRYMPTGGQFTARFALAGRTTPLDLRGRLDLMIEVPHLVAGLGAGTILRPEDVELRPVLVRYAEAGSVPAYHDVIGKELRRSSRPGMMLRSTDLAEPQLIARNQTVTLMLRSGLMTLTVKGRALNAAARDETVSVLNLMSNRVVSGIAVDAGTVAVTGSGGASRL